MREKLIEQKLRIAVVKNGGLALKLTTPGFTGIPDRLILMPNGKVGFVETKTTRKKPSPRQEVVIELLREMGYPVEVIDDELSLAKFLNQLKK